ncbi:MAG: hydrogenase iron-sulfur subunit [Saccharofermentanales bacterium]
MYDIAFIGSGFKTGFNTIVIKPEDLTKLKGQIGDFELSCRNAGGNSCVNAKTVVVNMEPAQVVAVDGARSFNGDISGTAVSTDDFVVFIQDYKSITPAYLNDSGIAKALQIKKDYGKEVIYFYKSLRFIDGDSSLFKNARQAGVIFEKYSDNDLTISKVDDLYTFKIENADYSFSVSSSTLFAAPVISADESFADMSKILNIISRKDGFFQYDNVYLQPTKTNKRGVYAIGFSRGQNGMSDFDDDIEFTISEINSELSSLKPLTANERKVDSDACALCYTCYRSCPHGAIERDYEKNCMKIDNLACFGCDTCLTVCPAKAISIDETDSDKPVKKDFKILMCENSAKIAYEQIGIVLDDKAEIRYIPCSNSIRKADIYKELSDMDSKVLVLGCVNDACKHIDSNKRFELVVNEAKKQMNELGLDPDRIRFERVSLRMKDKLKEIIDGFLGGIDK